MPPPRRCGPAIVAALFLTFAALPAAAQNTPNLDQLDEQIQAMFAAGRYAEALPLAEHFADSAKQQAGVDSGPHASALSWVGLLLWTGGRYAEAEPVFMRALEIDEKVFGPEHADVARDLNNLGSFYQEFGRFADAEPLIRRALALDEKLSGAEHPNVGRDANNLGVMLREQGRYLEAGPLLRRALAITEKAKGSVNPAVSIRLRNLAALFHDQGLYAEAEPHLKRALDIDEAAYTRDHPEVAKTLGLLGRLYREMHRYGDAEAAHLRALAIREKVFGVENARTAYSLNDLAWLYQDIGRNKQADELIRKTIAIREKALGADHPEVAFSLVILAGIQEKLGSPKDAEPLYQRALAIQEAKLGSNHPDLATTRANLGGLYKSQGRYDEALPLLQNALAVRERVLPSDHPAIASSLQQLGELHRLQGRRGDSEELFRRARTIRRASIREFPIFFATNRRRDITSKTLAFANDRDLGTLTLGIAQIAILKAPSLTPTAARSNESRPPENEESTDVTRITIQTLDEIKDANALIDAAKQQARSAQAFNQEVMIFIHGYNVSFENAVRRAGQIAYDLSFDGPTFVFSWPSRQSLLGYISDGDTVDVVAKNLKDFLQTIVAETKAKKVHLVAHSMGNLLLLRALGGMAALPQSTFAIGEVINAAPDVDPDLFAQFVDHLRPSGRAITVYASGADKALWFSGWLRAKPRIGFIANGVPTLIPGADIIDITNAGMGIFALNHDIYASSPIVVADMRRIFAGERPPDERTKEFSRVTSPKGTYWSYHEPLASKRD